MYVTVPGGSGFDPLGDGVTIAVKEFVQPYAYVYVMFSPPRSVGLANLRGQQAQRAVKNNVRRSSPHRSQGRGCSSRRLRAGRQR